MSALGHIATGAVALLAAVGLGACAEGGSEDKQVVARVGSETISKATMGHWVTVLRGGRTDAESAGGHAQALRRQALELLISRRWLIGEATLRGISTTGSQVRHQMDHVEGAEFPGGRAEREEFLKATGETVADLELQARAELASKKLRQMALGGAPVVTQAQIAVYYATHKRDFLIPGRRVARFRNPKLRARAEQIMREVEAGKSLSSPAQRRFHEEFTSARIPPGNPWERAIDAAKPHVVSGPYHIQADYWVYEVVKVIPAHQRALAEVNHSILRKLTNERRKKALADLTGTLTRRWTARTDCRSGYVVQRCRQYTGPAVSEDALVVQ